MTIKHKDISKDLTIEELRIYVNEYQKRKYNKERKKRQNYEYSQKIHKID